MFGLITRLLFAVGHYWQAYCERIGGTGPTSKTKLFFYRTCFHVGPICSTCFSTSAFLDAGPLIIIKQNHGRFFHTTSCTYICVGSKSKCMYKTSFWRTIKQNNKGLLQKFLFNRTPRSQSLEMKLVSKLGNIAQPLGSPNSRK